MTIETLGEVWQQSTATQIAPVTTRRILVAEDNDSMRRLLMKALRQDGHDVFAARNGDELMHWVHMVDHWHQHDALFDLIVTDLRMPGCSGQQCLTQLRRRGADIPVIVITAFGSELVHAEALASGAAAVFDKPLDLGRLRRAVAGLLEGRH